jgi:two-component system response regulator DevR
VVDSDDRVRESLAGLLGIGKDLIVVGSAGDQDAAISLVMSMSPDVVVIDPRLPELDGGLAFIRRVRSSAPHVRVVAMGWADGPEPRAVAAGVDGWVRKTFRPTELIAAILGAAAGRSGADPGLVL